MKSLVATVYAQSISQYYCRDFLNNHLIQDKGDNTLKSTVTNT